MWFLTHELVIYPVFYTHLTFIFCFVIFSCPICKMRIGFNNLFQLEDDNSNNYSSYWVSVNVPGIIFGACIYSCNRLEIARLLLAPFYRGGWGGYLFLDPISSRCWNHDSKVGLIGLRAFQALLCYPFILCIFHGFMSCLHRWIVNSFSVSH